MYPFRSDVQLEVEKQRPDLIGPTDPLGSAPDYADMGGLVQSIQTMSQLLSEMLVELRVQRPLLPVVIDGYAVLRQAETNPYFFLLSGKKVPSLDLRIQNNSGSLIYYAFSSPASSSDFQLAAGASVQINDAVVDFISFYTAAANITVKGIRNQQTPGGNGLVIQAWSNPEWVNVYGQI